MVKEGRMAVVGRVRMILGSIRSKPGFVNAIIYVVIRPCICLINLLP